ncbi:lipoprotein, partial [Streptomyces sp. NPDC048279]|uniref:lipoprotein n=1 Tax=Streptomyces sp. NPDC048279 TaxID=3154714 RepID=UPI003435FCAD
SACALPVTFDIARGWRAAAVEGPAAGVSDGTDADPADPRAGRCACEPGER